MGTTRPTPPGVAEILSEYVRMRQQQMARNEALAQLKPFAARLNEEARSQLLFLMRCWEARHGGKYEP